MAAVEDPWDAEFAPKAPVPRSKPRIYPNDILIEVESRMARKIIGKGGATIKSIKQQSGAFISVFKSEIYGMETVKISGSPHAKNVAKKLVEEFIESNQPQRFEQDPVEEVTNDVSDMSVSEIDWDKMREQLKENTKQRLAALPTIVKNVYKEHPEVTELSDKQVEDFRLSKNNIMVKYIDDNNNPSIPKPVLQFIHAFKDYPEIMKEIEKQKFEIPSPVQCQAWPIIMNGHDLIAIAQTGTGKTLAFLLPAFIHVDLQSTPRELRKGPTVLVLAPTRELVVQIENEVKKYSYKGIKVASIYGGTSVEKQRECLLDGVEIVIATPGRLNDFVNRGLVDLSDVSYLVLDEADRMLDLGFEPQIRLSLLKVRPDRQTVMTSATWPSGVKRLAKSYTSNAIQIMVGSLDLTTVNTVKQEILIMDQEEKELWLYDFLENIAEDDKVIIFVNRKDSVDDLATNLITKNFNVDSIHGGREQIDREMALENLRSGVVHILIATDVASRGIDIDDVTIIINYDLTKDIEEYVHRVGRTGRAGKTGHAITLMTKYDWSKAKDLAELLEKSGQSVPDELYDMAKRYEDKKNKGRAEGGNRPFRGRGGGRRFYGGYGSSTRYGNY